MRVLAMDTSSFHASVAVMTPEGCLCRVGMHTNRPSHTLLPALEAMLEGESMAPEDMDAFAVAIGPGSFTGVRVGMAAIEAMALAIGRPVVGVPTLDAVACAGRGQRDPLVVLQDARRGRVYAATYRLEDDWPVADAPPVDVEPELFLAGLPDGVAVLGDALEAHPGLRGSLPPGSRVLPADPYLAPAVGEIALRVLADGGGTAAGQLRPLYVRAADARLPAPPSGRVDD